MGEKGTMRALGMLAGLVLLAGCSVEFIGLPLDREAELAALRGARPPFATFDTLAYEKVAVPSFTYFQIMRGSEVMDVYPHGRTFAKGFELPAGPEGLHIEVASYLVPDKRAFHPIVTLLDEARNPIRSTWRGTVRVERRNPRWNYDWWLMLPVQITPEERVRVRYLVVHTSQDLVEVGFALPDEPWQEAGRRQDWLDMVRRMDESKRYQMPPQRGEPPSVPQIGSSPAGYVSLTITEKRW